MAIAFNLIPLSINTPGSFIEFDTSRAVQGTPAQPHTVLLAGIMGSGTATAGTIVKVKSPDDAVTKFGQHSPLAQLCAAYKSIDRLTEVFAYGFAEPTGTNASGTWTITGPATEDGALPFYVSGRRIEVAVTSGDTATDVGDALVTAHNLLTDSPTTVANAAGVVTATVRHDGPHGNGVKLGVALKDGESVPAGLAVAVVQPTSGATSEDYAALVTAMGEDQYNTIVITSNDSTEVAKIVTELEDRWGPMRQIEGSLFTSLSGTQGALTTAGNGYNSHTLVFTGTEANALLPAPWEVAGLVAARDAYQTQVDPARPRTGLVLGGASAPPRGSRFTRAERDTLLSDGVSTTKAASDGRLLIERLITTYQTNASGITDVALKDQTSVRTLAYLRYSIRARIASKYGRHKLADDGNERAGQPIVTSSILRAELIALFREWQDAGLVENIDQYKDELLVERDDNDPNRVNAIIPPDLINSFLVFAGQISFIR